MRSCWTRSMYTTSRSGRSASKSRVLLAPSTSGRAGRKGPGPTSVTSAPIFTSAGAREPTTRECTESPTMPTRRPSMWPKRLRMVYRSSRAWVGWACLPSPALTTRAWEVAATMLGVPAFLARQMYMSTPMESSVLTVSTRDSPFTTELEEPATESVSAPRRLQASSKELFVRVEGSRNRFTTVRPRRVGSFLMVRELTSSKVCAQSRICSMSSRVSSGVLMRLRTLSMPFSPRDGPPSRPPNPGRPKSQQPSCRRTARGTHARSQRAKRARSCPRNRP